MNEIYLWITISCLFALGVACKWYLSVEQEKNRRMIDSLQSQICNLGLDISYVPGELARLDELLRVDRAHLSTTVNSLRADVSGLCKYLGVELIMQPSEVVARKPGKTEPA